MGFFGFGASATSDEPIIPEEEELLVALRAAYRDPNISTTKAMHQAVLAKHPRWSLNLKRVRRLLCKVVSTNEAENSDSANLAPQAWVEEEEGDWCIISTPAVPAQPTVPKTGVRGRRGSS